MSKAKAAPVRPAYVPRSQIIWTDERLDALDNEQLLNLLGNLPQQRASGRVAHETADELELRIKSRLPARAIAVRRRRARSEVQLEARVAEQLTSLANSLAARYAFGSEPGADDAPNRAPAARSRTLADARGKPRVGGSVKQGRSAIDRYLCYRAGDSLAGLAFVLLAERPQQDGCFLIFGTDDLLDGETAPNDFGPIAEQHGWSASARARMRALPMADYAAAAQRFEALLARMAPRLS
jgi:hypothetical protein